MKSYTLKVDQDIALHGCHLAYAKDIFAMVNQERAYLEKWLPWVDITQKWEDTRDFLKSAHLMNKGGQQLNTWIFYQGKICGSIAFVKIDKVNDIGEIGYWLAQSKMGKGIVTKSCRRLIRYGFEKLNFKKIVIRVAEGNHSSIAIPLRLGFFFEGKGRQEIKIRQRYYDAHIFSILKEEFEEILTVNSIQ